MNYLANEHIGRRARAVFLFKLLDIATKTSLLGSCIALFLILGCYVFEVVMRYFFNSPTTWSNDVIQLFFAAMIMLAVPQVTRLNGHIVISFFLEKLTPTSFRKLERVIAIVGCAMCFLTAYICFEESLRQYQQNIEVMWNTPIPKWWISGLLPYGFMLSGLEFLRTIFINKKA